MSDTAVVDANDTAFFGHPKGLFILFFTEMWERFSYYGMRALLIFYLTQHFLFSDQRSALIYGAYTALVYVTPVIGGMLADRFLGARKAVTFGAVLLVIGHFGMAFEGKQASQYIDFNGQSIEVVLEGRADSLERFVSIEGNKIPLSFDKGAVVIEGATTYGLPTSIPQSDYSIRSVRNNTFLNIFYLSLAFIIAGVGFLKANISTIVGALYNKDDLRRDGGFTIFYMGINLGSFLSVLACGALGEYVGWWAGFGLAGIGMLAGLFVFLRGQPLLNQKAEPPNPAMLKEKVFGLINKEWAVYLGGFLMVLVAFLLIRKEGMVGDVLNGFGLFMVGTILFMSLFVFEDGRKAKEKPVRLALFCLAFFVLGLTVFGGIFAQYNEGVAGFMSKLNFSFPDLGNIDFINAILSNGLGTIGMLLVFASLIMGIMSTKSADRDKMLVVSFLILLQIPFWALFEQAGSSLNLFTARAVDRDLLGMTVPATAFQSLNALFIFMLAPVFAAVWLKLAKAGKEPSTPVKFALGILQVGIGFLVLVFGMNLTGADGQTAMIWIVLLYLFHTTGELCLSPVGLSAVTKLSMPRVVGMMMGAWFLASGFGNFVAGQIAASTGAETIGGQIIDVAAAKANYMGVYTKVAYVAIAIGILVLLISPILKKGMHGTK